MCFRVQVENAESSPYQTNASASRVMTLEIDWLLQVDEERKLRSAMDRAAERREADLKELQLRERNLQVEQLEVVVACQEQGCHA